MNLACPGCHTQQDFDSTFCDQCAAPLHPQSDLTEVLPLQSDSPKNASLMIVTKEDESHDAVYFYGLDDQMKWLWSLLASEDILGELNVSNPRQSWIRVQWADRVAACKLADEYNAIDKSRIVSPEQYALNRKRMLIILSVALVIAIGVFFIARQQALLWNNRY